ncbi:KH domain-containing, RNA-binding, signal transduction-associated protein 1-like, partial [Nycticebus coucang]|uniref:KH domain-containing, RNA-binding, signal transduction-associated protein 1-like n=1 Tax=Nycticebus coucang TaxID=9470 RepID=UPI00234DE904
MSRSSGRSGSRDPSGAHAWVRQTPSPQPPLPPRSRGGGGGSPGGARASPTTQPPRLLPPSATGPDATVGGPAPTPLCPPQPQ